jgi:hypothetical protein
MQGIHMSDSIHPGLAKAGQPHSVGGDLYSTPPSATRALLRTLLFSPHQAIWEPAAGEGAITRVLLEEGFTVTESDIRRWPSRKDYVHLLDFLAAKEARASVAITNPPFSLLTKFMEHALTLEGLERWAFLIPLPALAGVGRLHKVYHNNPPRDVVVLSHRVRFRRHGYAGKLASMATHAWAVWGRTTNSPTELHWADNRPGPGE